MRGHGKDRPRRGIPFEVHADTAVEFRGERQDLEEMAGNLLDNACKWALSRVFVEVLVERGDKAAARGGGIEGGPMLRIIVDDDGRGLSADERAASSRRGTATGRVQAGLGARIVDRGRSGRAVWGEPDAGHRADRGVTGTAA